MHIFFIFDISILIFSSKITLARSRVFECKFYGENGGNGFYLIGVASATFGGDVKVLESIFIVGGNDFGSVIFG